MQEASPGTAADRGLAMLVDQDDTPLFLGAIHRIFVGTTLEALHKATASFGVFTARGSAEAVAALAPGTLVVTDGAEWATLTLDLPLGTAAVEVLHASVLPALDATARRVEHHHSVDDTLRHLPRTGGVAVLMPAIEFDTVHRIVGRRSAAAGEGHVLPAQAQHGRPHALAARRMTRRPRPRPRTATQRPERS